MHKNQGKVIITVAITGGVHGKESNPNLPTQPGEIAEDVYRCWQAGASIVHIHARDNNDLPTGDPLIYRDIKDKIRAKECDIILQFTAGGSPTLSLEERLKPIEEKPEMASFSTGTLTISLGNSKVAHFSTPGYEIKKIAKRFSDLNIKPEIEVFNESWMREIYKMIDKGLIEKPYWINLVLGVNAQGGIDATPKNLMRMIDILPPESMFNVTAMGKAQLPLTTLSIILGGHVRVGMEDNIYYSKGNLAKNNAQFVERTVRIAQELGRGIATPSEARKLLNINSK